MSTHDTSHDLEIGIGDRAMPLKKLGPAALLVGGIATVVSVVMMLSPGTRETMMGSYLLGWYFWMTIVLGMLGLTCLHHTVRGSWALPWLKLIEAGSSPVALGVMFLLFIPMLIWPGTIYEWVNPGTDHLLLKKTWYLNHGAWAARTVIYFLIWTFMSYKLRNSVLRQERYVDDGTAESVARGRKIEMGRSSWGAVSIVVYVLSITFAFTDWGMSLQPHWYSTMYGVQQMIAGVAGASGLVVAILCINARKAPYTEVITPNLTKDWGNILFMWTMLWAYTTVSQFLIIWNGNLPETASFFARRGHMGWNALGMAMILGVWLIPWMSLLSPRVKRYPHLLRGIAGWIFFVHFFDVYYNIAPALPLGGFHEGHGRAVLSPTLLNDLLGIAAVGGIWLFVFAAGVQGAKYLLPNYDRRLQEALLHAH